MYFLLKFARMLNNTFWCAWLKCKRDDHGMVAVVAIIEGMEERAWVREQRMRKKDGGRGKEDQNGAQGRKEEEEE